MTTTERRRASSPSAAHTANLKLYLVALLAVSYVGAWWLLGLRAPADSDEARALEPRSAQNVEHGMATWFHDLPASERPLVSLPEGWRIADPASSSPTITARAEPVRIRVSPTRARRLRTRSS